MKKRKEVRNAACSRKDICERRLLPKDRQLLLIRNDGYLSVRQPICQKSSRSTHQPPSKLAKICG